jgi:hypothetical protein
MHSILDVVRQGFGKYKISRNGKQRHRGHYIVHVGSEADLMLLRLSDEENLVFRVYKLVQNA